MNPRLGSAAVPALRWTLGLVVALESIHFLISPAVIRQVHAAGISNGFRLALGCAELVAALLFLVPGTLALGGYLLMGVFAAAIGVHFRHDRFDVGGLVVYGMAALVCVAHREKSAKETEDDRR